jgi:hypothetical protein
VTRLTPLIVAGLLAVSAAGCGRHDQPSSSAGGQQAPPPTPSAQSFDAALEAYAACLRGQGVPITAQQIQQHLNGSGPRPLDPADPNVQAAQAACQTELQAILDTGTAPR